LVFRVVHGDAANISGRVGRAQKGPEDPAAAEHIAEGQTENAAGSGTQAASLRFRMTPL
jgi:hypothetical protein